MENVNSPAFEFEDNSVVEFDATATAGYSAKIVMDTDGDYHVVDSNGVGPKCKLCGPAPAVKAGGTETIVLTKNDSNRQWFNRAKADAAIAEHGYCELTYKESKHFGPAGSSLLKNPLMAYMTDEEKADYIAIVQKAIDAKAADKSVPVTDVDKAKAKLEKAKAKYEKLLAELNGGANNE